MKYDFLVLGGGGMQGKIVARDLLEHGYRVFLADLYREGAARILKRYPKSAFEYLDIRNIQETTRLIKKSKASVVINCAEGDWNLHAYKAALRARAHIIDLGSEIPMTKAQFAMHKVFRRLGLTALTGCGSTPGINNVMLHYSHQFFDHIRTVEVGFAWDSNIKKFVVPFSIQSIIEEFTDPAPFIEKGKWHLKRPLETIKEKKFRAIGKQKCFLVRHPETYTFFLDYKNDGLKNIHFYAGFPKHSFDAILAFIELGLGNKEKISVDGTEIVPVEALSQVLRKLPIPEGYTEKENLWVMTEGVKNGAPRRVLMECIVPTLRGWEDAGCNIDTGMPASIIAQMIKNDIITDRGSFAPESIVPEKPFFKELRKRKMIVYQNGRPIN